MTLETPAPDFLKAVHVEGSTDGIEWTRLGSGEPLFRQFGASRLQVPLDDRAWPHLRLTLDNRRSRAIPITGARVHPAPPVRVPDRPIGAEIVDHEETAQQTRLTLRLSVGSATLGWLKLQTPEPLFARTVSVVHRRVNETGVTETALARDTIFRLAADGVTAEDVAVEVKAIIPTREVILVIDNGDSPPMPVTGVVGDGHPASLTFHTGERRDFHVLGGNPHAMAPRYDVAQLVGQLTPNHVSPQTIGALAVNPAWRAPEALPGLDLRGTPIDLNKWKFRKPLTLAAPGVQKLELDLEVLAHADPNFADLRVVRDGRQLPYLLDRTPIERQFAPVATRVTDPKRPTASLWELKLPQRSLPLSRIECATSAVLFQRTITITEERRDNRGCTQRVGLGGTEWVRTPDKKTARLAVVFLQAPLTDTVRLEVENGDNPALELADFTCSHPTARVLFQADPGAETFLYFANPAATTARYDLNLVAHQLISTEKSKATLGPATLLQLGKLGAGDAGEGSGAGK